MGNEFKTNEQITHYQGKIRFEKRNQKKHHPSIERLEQFEMNQFKVLKNGFEKNVSKKDLKSGRRMS